MSVEYSSVRANGTTSYVRRDWGCFFTVLSWVVSPILLGLIVFSVSVFQAPLQLETEIAGGIVESVQTGDVVPLRDRLIQNGLAVACITGVGYFLAFLYMHDKARPGARIAFALAFAVIVAATTLTMLQPTVQWGVAVGGVVHQEQVNTVPPGPSPLLKIGLIVGATVVLFGGIGIGVIVWAQSESKSE